MEHISAPKDLSTCLVSNTGPRGPGHWFGLVLMVGEIWHITGRQALRAQRLAVHATLLCFHLLFCSRCRTWSVTALQQQIKINSLFLSSLLSSLSACLGSGRMPVLSAIIYLG